MPFAKTWTEEIVAEWLLLKGYSVEIGLPVGARDVGGRFEADIVGAKVEANTLKIIHAEVGTLAGGQGSVISLQKKFSNNICSTIENYFREIFAFTGKNVNYKKLYVASFWTKPVINNARKIGINVRPLPDFLCEEVLQTIHDWKNNPPYETKSKGKVIMLPDAYWLLHLIDFLDRKKMLICTSRDSNSKAGEI